MTGTIALQDMGIENHCFGCGPDNEHGLHIKSYWSDDRKEVVCTWQPELYHLAGPTHILNGGIIATILDCHGVWTGISAAYQTEGREIGSDPELWYATGSLQITYLRPTPVARPVRLVGMVKEIQGKRITSTVSLYSEDKECARAAVLAVRVPDSWRQRGDHAMHSE